MNLSKRTLSRALTPLIALTLAALLPAAPASAHSPQELVEQCVTAIAHTTQHTVGAVHATGVEGAHRIAALDDNDAPVPVMVRVAQLTNNAIERRAQFGAAHVNEIAGKCLRILANAEANPALAQIVLGAREQALGAIRTAAVNTHMAVRGALESALEDEETPAVAGGVSPFDPASPS